MEIQPLPMTKRLKVTKGLMLRVLNSNLVSLVIIYKIKLHLGYLSSTDTCFFVLHSVASNLLPFYFGTHQYNPQPPPGIIPLESPNLISITAWNLRIDVIFSKMSIVVCYPPWSVELQVPWMKTPLRVPDPSLQILRVPISMRVQKRKGM